MSEPNVGELFELSLYGEGIEKRFRRMRPEVMAMPWGTLSTEGFPEKDLILARKAWTGAAFQEHRTGIACAATLRALMECRAPLDLISVATRFPLDEMVHVELCARMAMELGGGTEIVHDPTMLIVDGDEHVSPIVRAGDLVVRFFCVGEALSIPLLRGTWKAAQHPLPRAVLGRIVKDEAVHGTFGFAFLDWACQFYSPEDLAYLGHQADRAIRAIMRQWEDLKSRPPRPVREGDSLAWMETGAYLRLAEKSMRDKVVQPLVARGIPITAFAAVAPPV
jgi:hypothetical protein